MKQVYLHFKELELGFLTEQDGAYVWVPNAENINTFKTKYDGAQDLFMLSLTQPEAYEQIPYHFVDFVESAGRADLMQKAGITAGDSEFDVLCKMATLTYFGQDFFISL